MKYQQKNPSRSLVVVEKSVNHQSVNELVRVGGVASSAFPGDSILFLRTNGRNLPQAMTVMRAWGYEYQNIAFTWVKLRPDYDERFHANASQDVYGIAVDDREIVGAIEQYFVPRHNTELIVYGKHGPQPLYLMNHYAHEVIVAPANNNIMPEVRSRIVDLFQRPQDKLYRLDTNIEDQLNYFKSQAQIPEPVEEEQRIITYEQDEFLF